ncbi:MAG: glycerol-3-phosphate dehydrogenase [Hyphomicrobiales bacterium]
MTGTETSPFDVFIIGGGVNGCGIARDAAGRGYSVCLCEKGDLASGTSSASTKLVHGGLRYLEHYEFHLVRKSLMEREVLWQMAPHIIWPLRFVLPHHEGLRPAWLLRMGLFLYDNIGGRNLLPPTSMIELQDDPAGEPLKEEFKMGMEYSDCWVDDSRLVVLNACDAKKQGADIRTRTKVVGAKRANGLWDIELEDRQTSELMSVRARVLVNASGPWVDQVLGEVIGKNHVQNVRLVRGSHIVVRKLFEHDRSYIFQNKDGRIIFAIPYERDFTLIGTTDEDQGEDIDDVQISVAEVEYLCATASSYLKKPVMPDDVVWTYSGVRPLFDDGASRAQEATRDYVIRHEGGGEEPLLINVFGGKITTFRRLSELVLEEVETYLGAKGRPWTANSKLPGGDFRATRFDELKERYEHDFPFIAREHIERLLRNHGTRTRLVLGDAQNKKAMGRHFGAGLYQTEVDYFMRSEWALDAEDILYRRTKLGLLLTDKQKSSLDAYMKEYQKAAKVTESAD